MSDLPEIVRGWAAQRGDVVFLQMARPIRSRDEATYYRDMAAMIEETTGVHLVFLDDGTKVVEIEREVIAEDNSPR